MIETIKEDSSRGLIKAPRSIKRSITSVDYLELAEDNPGEGVDFGHEYLFPAEFQYVKFAVEDELCYPLLVGEASAGKSRMCQEIALRIPRHDAKGNPILDKNDNPVMGRPVIRINLEEITDEEDLVGCPQLITNPKNGNSETIYVPGILLEAWLNGWVLVFDELDRSTKAARKQLNMVTEKGGMLMVKSHQGFKFFKKHPDATIIFTSNTWGHGDFTGMYDGAEPLNTAWLSRIGPKFEIKTDWSVYQEVLKHYGLSEKVLHLLFEKDGGAVQSMHSIIKQSNLQESITLRSFIRFAICYEKFSWHFGLEVCVINEFKEFNRQKMRVAISKKCGNNFEPTTDFDIINSEKVQTALREVGL